MDTGDAAGDVMFGLDNLLLPVLCPVEPDFTWCANRQYLSGGQASMVYTEFVVESDARFGEYNACNPNKDTGVFECETYDASSTPVPPQCAAGYELYHEDCLNGTVYANVKTLPDMEAAEGDCCDHCTRAGENCAGWNLSPVHKDGSRTCELFSHNLSDWTGAQKTVGCKAAVRDPTAFACWYTNPLYNVSFRSECDRSRCTCDAVDRRSVGREQHAMCWHGHKSNHTSGALRASMGWGHSVWFEYINELACLLDGNWYSTQAQGECRGPKVDDSCWWRLAETGRTVNATCVNDRVVAAIQQRRPGCWSSCPQPGNQTSPCYLKCLFETIVGNKTKGIPALTREQVTAPFEQAFLPEDKAGCPRVVCRGDADCRLAGDGEARCDSHTGGCTCDAGFEGQFCTRTRLIDGIADRLVLV